MIYCQYDMIQKIEKIEKEFILKSAFDSKIRMRLHGASSMIQAFLTGVSAETLELTCVAPPEDGAFSVFEQIAVYFDCGGKTYTFTSKIRKRGPNALTVDTPSFLNKSLQRKFIRVKKPRNFKILFQLANEEIRMDYPVCPEYVTVEKSEAFDMYGDGPLPVVMAEFRNALRQKCTVNSIVMFRTKKPELFEEMLISETGKVLFIPSTDSALPKNDPYPSGRIITESIEERYEDPNFLVEGTYFQKLLDKKKEKGIAAEIWCPIVFYQYVVGYIYAANSGGVSFDFSMIDCLWDFSRILAYRLKEIGYFQTARTKDTQPGHTAKIIDMTPEGILMAVPDDELKIPIKADSSFLIKIIPEDDREISCSAKVRRRYSSGGVSYYGAQFVNMQSADMMRIFELLYRKKYKDNEPLAFENGAAPS